MGNSSGILEQIQAARGLAVNEPKELSLAELSCAKMLERQSYLNSFLENKPAFPQLTRATLDEIGEIIHLTKKSWVWWPREKPYADWAEDELAEEVADLLHFALTWVLQMGGSSQAVLDYASGWGLLGLAAPKDPLPDLLVALGRGNGSRVLYATAALSKSLGVSREKLEAAYWAKTNKNLERWGVRVESAFPEQENLASSLDQESPGDSSEQEDSGDSSGQENPGSSLEQENSEN